jgi:eukaryotic-like serine/threonine-protein kinase
VSAVALPALGRYEIVSELGRGAMGVVYKARDPMLERTVAIKTVNMALEEDGAAQYEARFQQEARAAGGLNHPNIVTIHDIGKSGDIAYMAMEYLEGVELRSLLQTGQPLPVPKALSIAAQIAEGLAYAHERGVVHRDIKPPNIMVLANGIVKITDFGIARMRTSAVQTQAGLTMGSPKYMSPEQVLGKRADQRSDIFSLGIILYEMLAGAAPFTGESMTALMYQIVNFAPPAPSALKPAVPEMLDTIIAKMLAKSIDERYQSAAELARDLRACEKQLAHPLAVPAREPAAPTFAPGAEHAAINTSEREVVLKRATVHSRREDAVPAMQTEPPARGLARSFDSNEATMRLAALTQSSPGASNASPAKLAPLWRRWGRRDTLAVAAAALAGLAVAAFLLLR